MASADRVDLMRLLLRQIDRHPPGAIDGVDLANADPSLVERLLSDRILTEEPPLEDIGPSQRSQDDLPRPIWRRGHEALAFSIEGGSAPKAVDPRALVHYPINLLLLCRAIRKDNQLEGSGPEILSPRTILIGWRGYEADRRPVVLCRLLRDGNAYEDTHMLSHRLRTERLILLTSTERVLGVDVLNSLRNRGIEILPAELALKGSVTRPFALRIEEWSEPPSLVPDPQIALLVDTSDRRAFFFGQELALRPREFKVLVELVRAWPSRKHVTRDQLYQAMYPEWGEGDARVYDEQVVDAVSRLRTALRQAAAAAGRTVDNPIRSRRKLGYQLAEELGSVRVM